MARKASQLVLGNMVPSRELCWIQFPLYSLSVYIYNMSPNARNRAHNISFWHSLQLLLLVLKVPVYKITCTISNISLQCVQNNAVTAKNNNPYRQYFVNIHEVTSFYLPTMTTTCVNRSVLLVSGLDRFFHHWSFQMENTTTECFCSIRSSRDGRICMM